MDGKYYKKAAAVVLAFSLVCGCLPAGLDGGILPAGNAVTAEASSTVTFDEATGTLTLSSYFTKADLTPYRGEDSGVKRIVAAEDCVLPYDCSRLFENFFTAGEIDLSKAETFMVNDTSLMFNGCWGLRYADLTCFGGNDYDLCGMFGECSSLQAVYITTDGNYGESTAADGAHIPFVLKTSSTLFDLQTDTLKLYGNVVMEEVQSFRSGYPVKSVIAEEGAVLPKDCTFMFEGFVLDSSETNWKQLESIDLSKADATGVDDMSYMFYFLEKLTSLNIKGLDTSNVRYMQRMFSACYNLKSIDLSSFSTASATDLSGMFFYCSGLTSLDLRSFDTSKVQNMAEMFEYCSGLSSVILSSFNTSKVRNMKYMFEECRNLTSLDLTSFDTSGVMYMDEMFRYCTKLSAIYVSDKWSTAGLSTSTNMFGGDTKLVGGYGTGYSSAHVDGSYARIDKAGEPGYLTEKNSVSFDAVNGILYLSGNVVKKDVQDYSNHSGVKKVIALEGTVFPADCSFMFDNFSAVSIDLDKAYTGNVTNMCGMFESCKQLTFLSMKNWFTYKVTDMSRMFNNCEKLPSLDILSFNTAMVTNMSFMFTGCKALTSLQLSRFDTANVTLMSSTFSGCEKLTSLDLSSFDTSKVTSLQNAFYNCRSLTSLDLSSFDTSDVTNMNRTFANCQQLKFLDLHSFDTTKVRDVRYMFYNCKNLRRIYVSDRWNTGRMEQSEAMFGQCTSLEGEQGTQFTTVYTDSTYARVDILSINQPGYFSYSDTTFLDEEIGILYLRGNVSKPELEARKFNTDIQKIVAEKGCVLPANCSGLFDGTVSDSAERNWENVTVIDLSEADTSRVTDMSRMFKNLNNLKKLDISGFDTSNVSDMSGMFYACAKLTSLDLSSFNTSNVTLMNGMFASCENLTSLDLSSFNTSNVTSMEFMFSSCSELENLDISQFNTSDVTRMNCMFMSCKKLQILDLSSFDTSKVTDMGSMFHSCDSLRKVYVSDKWNTDNVTSSQNMFMNSERIRGGDNTPYDSSIIDKTYARIDRDGQKGYLTNKCCIFDEITGTLSLRGYIHKSEVAGYNSSSDCKHIIAEHGSVLPADCSGIFMANNAADIDLSQADSSNVTSMSNMFRDNPTLTNVDLRRFSTSKVTNMTRAFYNCATLTTITVTDDWKVPSGCSCTYMFYNDTSIKGGNRTTYDSSHTGGDYARIDKPGQPGYLTRSCCYTNAAGDTLYLTGDIVKSDIDQYKYVSKGIKNVIALDDAVLPADCTNLFEWSPFENIDLSKADSSKVKSMRNMFMRCQSMKTLDLSGIDTSKVTDMGGMFGMCLKLETLDLSGFDTSKVTNMTSMFGCCESLRSVDLTSFDTSAVVSMRGMFTYCKKLESLNLRGFDTSSVTTFYSMFSECFSLSELDLSAFDTSKVTSTEDMFAHDSALTTIYVSDKWNMSGVTSSADMFVECNSIVGGSGTLFNSRYTNKSYARIDEPGHYGYLTRSSCCFDKATGTLYLSGDIRKSQVRNYSGDARVKKVIADDTAVFPADSSEMFSGFRAVSIDLGRADTSAVTDMSHMFTTCRLLTDLDISGFDTSNVTTMYGMFYNSAKLVSLDLSCFSTGKVNNMKEMFRGCSALSSIIVSDSWTTAKVTVSTNMFNGCKRLEGGNGTKYNSGYLNKTYARIDKAGQKGYLTEKCCRFDKDTGTLYLFGNVGNSAVQAYSGNAAVRKVMAEEGAFLPADCYNMFSGFMAREIDLSEADSSGTTNMYTMFWNCPELTKLSIYTLDTSDVTSMDAMFCDCPKLTELDLSSFNTALVDDMEEMFSGCSSLDTIYVSDKWSVSSVTSSTDMFAGCNKLVGGNGTAYSSSHRNLRYACVDTAETPGYFTLRDICFRTNSMTLGGSISLNFYASLIGIPEEKLADTRVEFEVNGKHYTAALDPNKRNSKGYYCFTCPLNSISMADDVRAVMHYGLENSEERVIKTISSCETYLKKFSDKDEAKLWNIIKSINDYGYYMQRYLCEHSGRPWTLGVEHKAMEKAYCSHDDYLGRKDTYLTEMDTMQRVWGENASLASVKFSLVLDSDTAINFKVEKKKGYTGPVKVKLDDKTVTPVTLSDGRLQYTVSGISAHLLNKPHTLTVTTNSGTTTYTASALSYAYECIKAPKYDSEYDAMCALYEYYKATIAYKKK